MIDPLFTCIVDNDKWWSMELNGIKWIMEWEQWMTIMEQWIYMCLRIYTTMEETFNGLFSRSAAHLTAVALGWWPVLKLQPCIGLELETRGKPNAIRATICGWVNSQPFNGLSIGVIYTLFFARFQSSSQLFSISCICWCLKPKMGTPLCSLVLQVANVRGKSHTWRLLQIACSVKSQRKEHKWLCPNKRWYNYRKSIQKNIYQISGTPKAHIITL